MTTIRIHRKMGADGLVEAEVAKVHASGRQEVIGEGYGRTFKAAVMAAVADVRDRPRDLGGWAWT